jgi:hypothetical protein
MSEAGIPETAPTEEREAPRPHGSQVEPRPGRSFVERLTGVLRLDSAAYDDVADDPGALGQAAVVVGFAALARSLSAEGGPLGGQGIAFMIQVGATWPIAAFLIWALGNWFGHPASFARVLRVIGFALAPLLITALTVLPAEFVRVAIDLLSTALLIATFVVGTRQALRATTGRAAFVCIVLFMVVMFAFMVFQYLMMSSGAA